MNEKAAEKRETGIDAENELPIRTSRKAAKDTLNSKFISETIGHDAMSEETVQRVTDFFRYIFNNEWPDYAVCPPCDSQLPGGARMSAKEAYKSDDPVPLAIMDSNPILPNCSHCGSQMQIFHNPGKLRSLLNKKLMKDGYVSFINDPESGETKGFAYGYGTTLEEAFHGEWGNAYGYMADPDPAYDRDLTHLLECLNGTIKDTHFTPEMEIFLWNCVGITPAAQGGANYIQVMRGLFNQLPPEKRNLRIVAEVLIDSPAHIHFNTTGAIDVPGFLKGDGTIIVFKVGETTDIFNLSLDEYYKRREIVKQNRKR
jgi:hypothetical protein